ncbi:putative sterigmatocystin biosynthesis P450 monooxygenase, partial [Lachnellula suecica]
MPLKPLSSIVEVRPNLAQGVAIVLVTYVTYYIAFAIYNVFFHPLARFPGPKLWSISRLPLIRAHFKGKLHHHFQAAHETYGPIVRIAPNELTTTDPAAWKDLYQSRPALPKDPFSLTPPLNGADSLFTANGETHGRIRRLFSTAFSEKALKEQIPVIESQVNDFVLKIRRDIAVSGATNFDIAKLYGYVALDIVGELCFGEALHSLENDSENNLIPAFALGAKFGSLRTSMSRFYPWDMIIGFFALRFTAKRRNATWNMMTRWITRRLEMGHLGTGRSDFVTPVIGNIENGKKDSISRAELDTNIGAIALAGSALPTVALTTATYFILRNPHVLHTLKEEIRSKFSSELEINVESTKDLTYLDAVISETLRIHRATPSQLPRVINKGGQMVCGEFIPGGTVMGIALHATQTSSANWVEPYGFYPERWLNEKHALYNSRFSADNKEAYRPFSAGPRNCIGN